MASAGLVHSHTAPKTLTRILSYAYPGDARLVHVHHRSALVTNQCRPETFGLRTQSLAANVHTGKVRQQLWRSG